MTEIEMLKRVETYTMELIHQEESKNDIFKEKYGYDNPIHMKMLGSYWDDIFDIWEKIDELENK